MYSNNDFRSYKSDELCHFGVLGMKWGIRRYQNPDGSLTDEGRRHYGYESERDSKRQYKEQNQQVRREHRSEDRAQYEKQGVSERDVDSVEKALKLKIKEAELDRRHLKDFVNSAAAASVTGFSSGSPVLAAGEFVLATALLRYSKTFNKVVGERKTTYQLEKELERERRNV